MHINISPYLAFIIKIDCVFCEVQTVAEEILTILNLAIESDRV